MGTTDDTHKTNGALREAILALITKQITPEQFAALQQRLREDPEARRYYIEFVMVHLGLRQASAGGERRPLEELLPGLADPSLWKALSSMEKAAEPVFLPAERSRVEAKEPVIREPRPEISKCQVLFAIGTMAAAALFVVVLRLLPPRNAPPSRVPVAVLSESQDARWRGNAEALVDGASLYSGALRLREGYARIVLERGAELLLQAPVDLELLADNEVALQGGKITCAVPPTAVGFTIRAPGSTIVDYGTEYGVLVDRAGRVETEVFKGLVALRSGDDAVRFREERRLVAGQIGRMDAQGRLSVNKASSAVRRFVRRMPRPGMFGRPGRRLDLADIVGGGNGFGTGRVDHVIQIDTGTLRPRRHDTMESQMGGRHTVTPTIPFVDSVFVPDVTEDGPVVVASDQTVFRDCPDTSGWSYGDVANGGVVRHTYGLVNSMVLDGRPYGTALRPAIFMHSNMGVTFDLDAIRDSMPGMRVERFTTLCGVCESLVQEVAVTGSPRAVVDFWVLVDGRVRFSKKGGRPADEPSQVDISLDDGDQFLSLVVTDSNGQITYDWGLFALPTLELGE